MKTYVVSGFDKKGDFIPSPKEYIGRCEAARYHSKLKVDKQTASTRVWELDSDSCTAQVVDSWSCYDTNGSKPMIGAR